MDDLTRKPGVGEVPEYFTRYVDMVEPGDIRDVLERQGASALAKLRSLREDLVSYSYAPGKWTVGEVISHLSDTERVFAYRAFWFARGLEAPLPGFDQDEAVTASGARERRLDSLLEEFEAVRLATTTLFRGSPAEAWSRRGTANQVEYTVKALAFVMAGHVTHHLKLLDERYLGG